MDESGRLAGLLPHSDVAHRESGADRLTDQLLLPPVPVDHDQQEQDYYGHDAGHHPGGDVDVVCSVGSVGVTTVDAVNKLLDVGVVTQPDDLEELLGLSVDLLHLGRGGGGGLRRCGHLHGVAELSSVVFTVVGLDSAVQETVPVDCQPTVLSGPVVTR